MRNVGEIYYYLIDEEGGREFNTLQEIQAVIANEGLRSNKKEAEAIVVKAEVVKKRVRSFTEVDYP